MEEQNLVVWERQLGTLSWHRVMFPVTAHSNTHLHLLVAVFASHLWLPWITPPCQLWTSPAVSWCWPTLSRKWCPQAPVPATLPICQKAALPCHRKKCEVGLVPTALLPAIPSPSSFKWTKQRDLQARIWSPQNVFSSNNWLSLHYSSAALPNPLLLSFNLKCNLKTPRISYFSQPCWSIIPCNTESHVWGAALDPRRATEIKLHTLSRALIPEYATKQLDRSG